MKQTLAIITLISALSVATTAAAETDKLPPITGPADGAPGSRILPIAGISISPEEDVSNLELLLTDGKVELQRKASDGRILDRKIVMTSNGVRAEQFLKTISATAEEYDKAKAASDGARAEGETRAWKHPSVAVDGISCVNCHTVKSPNTQEAPPPQSTIHSYGPIPQRPGIEELLAQADLTAVLKQYDKVIAMRDEAELKTALLDLETEPADKERGELAHRAVALRDLTQELRRRAIDLDGQIQKRRATETDAQGTPRR